MPAGYSATPLPKKLGIKAPMDLVVLDAPTDITEDTIRELALPLGFVDTKVCAVTDVWSGLKLVVRKQLRGAAARLEV